MSSSTALGSPARLPVPEPWVEGPSAYPAEKQVPCVTLQLDPLAGFVPEAWDCLCLQSVGFGSLNQPQSWAKSYVCPWILALSLGSSGLALQVQTFPLSHALERSDC